MGARRRADAPASHRVTPHPLRLLREAEGAPEARAAAVHAGAPEPHLLVGAADGREEEVGAPYPAGDAVARPRDGVEGGARPMAAAAS